MKLTALALIFGSSMVALGCSSSPNDALLGDMDPNSLASGDNTQNHQQDPNEGTNGISDPNQVNQQNQSVGSPEVVARLHACSKITYAGLANILVGRGVNMSNNQTNSAGMLYKGGASALGVANYPGRVPEMIIPSTAALSKEFDILVAASLEIQPQIKGGTLKMPSCPSTELVDTTGAFTQDGLTCLMGKPATADHVTIANSVAAEAVSQGLTSDQGQQIAIAAILEAAHTCE
jgi:hypothetical protein